MKKTSSGYTLVEVLVTVIIIGVMAGLALPSYFSTVEQARSNEAKINLQIIRAGQKIYALNHGGLYWSPGADPPLNGDKGAAINPTLNIDIAKKYYEITKIAAVELPTPMFEAVAKRNTVQGGDGTREYKIDQNGTITPAD